MIVTACIAGLLLVPASCPAMDSTDEVIESITAAEMRDHIYFLASDYLNGRAPGLAGYEIAANYGASQFKHAGLDSVILSPEGGKTFFQEVSFLERHLARCTITVDSPAGPAVFELGRDFKPRLFDFGLETDLTAKVVFAGFGISEPEAGWDDLAGLDVKGKIVIVLSGAPERDGEPVLPAEMHERYAGPRGMTPKIEAIARRGPAAIVIQASERALELWDNIPNDGSWPTVVMDEDGSRYYHFIHMDIPRFLLVGTTLLIAKNEVIEAMLSAEGYRAFTDDGAAAQENYRTFEAEKSSIRMTVSFDEEPITTWNVIAGLAGSDPALRDEYVVLGAHLDHFPPRGDQVMNGADDNASGCAGLMEIAEALSLARPRRSVLFVLLTGEEVGLLGSRYCAMNLPVPAEKVIAYINLDMIGRAVEETREQRGVFVSGADVICETPWKLVGEANDPAFGVGIVRHADDETFRRSDQRFFSDAGIPTIGFETGVHEDYHRPTDDPEKVDIEKARDIARLVCAFVRKLCDTDEPPCAAERGL